jgi:hypothetical protein
MQRFYDKISSMLDFAFLSYQDLYLDITVKMCLSKIYLATAAEHEAYVYLFKRCCLEKSLEALYKNDPMQSQGTSQFYSIKFLYQACNLTSVPPKGSRIFKGGLRYVQCYAVEKEISDAGTIYPFSNPSLTELCLDPVIWSTAAASAQWKGKKSRSTIVNSYCQSKRRVKCTYKDSRTKSFGVRTEYRITGTLFLELLRQYQEQEELKSPALMLPSWDQTPSFV